MAATPLAATLDTPISELRPASVERILVIEDDGALRKILRRLFSSEGYEVDAVPDGVGGLEMLRQRASTAVILDLQQEESSGSEVADKVLLLEIRAQEHVSIPFSPVELIARLRVLIRCATRVDPEDVYVFGDVMVDFSKMEITRGGEKIAVTAKEFKTLEFLTKNSGRVISRDELLNEVWGYQNYPTTRTVDNHILRLRQKLERNPSDPSHFLTVHGVGYKFVP